MDFDQVTERVVAGLVQGFIIAFVGLAAFLPASYVMNRFIYRSWLMRGFMGVVAALTGMGGLMILLIMRAYLGSEYKHLHYFGLLPILTKIEEPVSTDRTWFMSIFKWLTGPILPPITFYYNSEADKKGYAATIDTLLENFSTGEQKELSITGLPADMQPAHKNTVHEPLFHFARAFGHVWNDTTNDKHWGDYISTGKLPEPHKYEGYGGLDLTQASAIGASLFAS